MSNYDRIAYWLVPSADERSALEKIVDDLAMRYGGPLFVPHITICVGGYQNKSEVTGMLESIDPFEEKLACGGRGIAFEESYTKCCFVGIEETEAISSLHRHISRRIPDGTNYHFAPHLSLFYGKLSPNHRQEICSLITPPKSFLFSHLVAIGLPIEIQSAKDVDQWIEIGRTSIVK